jgi:GGDEF domain-containing protein
LPTPELPIEAQILAFTIDYRGVMFLGSFIAPVFKRAAGIHRETSWSFIQRTDEALYAAKRKGRNCWVVIKEIDGDRL